jgi:hypothetical protein
LNFAKLKERNMQIRMTIVAALIAVLAAAGASRADLVYNDGGTHTISTALPVEGVGVSNGTTLNVATGGVVTGPVQSGGWGTTSTAITIKQSTLNINGGEVDAGAGAYSSIAIVCTGGTVNVNSGTVSGGARWIPTGISGGTVNVYGGLITGRDATDVVNANVSGGTITGTVCASGVTNIRGGNINVPSGVQSWGVFGSSSTAVVNIYNGASITVAGAGATTYGVYSDGALNIYGGSISCSGGYPEYGAYANGPLNVYGGTINASVCGLAGGTVQGGAIDVGVGVQGGTMNITGGAMGGVGTAGGTVNIGACVVSATGQGWSNGWNQAVSTSGGVTNILPGSNIRSVSGDWDAGVDNEGGTVNIKGGNIFASAGGAPSAAIECLYGGGTTNIWGGKITYSGYSRPYNGGYCGGIVAESGTINIYGSGFNYPFGSISATSGELIGTLSDGSAIDLTFDLASSGQIVLYQAPEPATLPLLALGGLAMLRRRNIREVVA